MVRRNHNVPTDWKANFAGWSILMATSQQQGVLWRIWLSISNGSDSF
jgi:hypothetical protein